MEASNAKAYLPLLRLGGKCYASMEKPVFFIYRGILRKEFETCFYWWRMLHKTHHVDHVIPRSFYKIRPSMEFRVGLPIV